MAITEEQRAEWMRLAEQATPGPWAPYGDSHLPEPGWEVEPEGAVLPKICRQTTEADAAFIAAAREAMPALLAENAALRRIIASRDP